MPTATLYTGSTSSFKLKKPLLTLAKPNAVNVILGTNTQVTPTQPPANIPFTATQNGQGVMTAIPDVLGHSVSITGGENTTTPEKKFYEQWYFWAGIGAVLLILAVILLKKK